MTATPVYARRFVSLVKLEHTVFALPYAYAGAVLAAGEVPAVQTLAWITVAMVGARSLAMALNRLIDAGIDARNPRTARRELPAGLLTPVQVAAFAAASLAVFLVAVWQLPPITHVLWPIPVAGFVIYPYLKRFTLAVPSVPGSGRRPRTGGRLDRRDRHASTGSRSSSAGPSRSGSAASTSSTRPWTSRSTGARACTRSRAGSGSARRLLITRIAHAGSVVLLIWLGIDLGLGPLYWLGLAVVAVLLAYENSIVSEDDLSRVDMAFLRDERRDRDRVPGRGAGRCARLRRSSATASFAGSGSATPWPG